METTVDHLLKEATHAQEISKNLYGVVEKLKEIEKLQICYEFAETELPSLAGQILEIAKTYDEISKSSYEQALKEHNKEQK